MTIHNVIRGANEKANEISWQVERKSLLGKCLLNAWSGMKINIEEIKEKVTEISKKYSITKQTCLQNIGTNPDLDILRFYYVYILNGIEEERNTEESEYPEITWF
jgi:hypothetical protein